MVSRILKKKTNHLVAQKQSQLPYLSEALNLTHSYSTKAGAVVWCLPLRKIALAKLKIERWERDL